jgi:AraC-like DNA-binding protein
MVTPRQYLIQYRISVADVLLDQGKTVKDAAESVRIDSKVFGRVYRKYRRINPTEAHGMSNRRWYKDGAGYA